MRTIRGPASVRRAGTRPAGTLAGRRRSSLLVTLTLAVAAIYFVHLGRGIGLGVHRIDLEVYCTGAKVLLHGGDLYGPLPPLGDGQGQRHEQRGSSPAGEGHRRPGARPPDAGRATDSPHSDLQACQA